MPETEAYAMETGNRANGSVRMAESAAQEAYGASQIGPFDYCPKLGFREYWYPGVLARTVRGKPVHMQMLGDDLVATNEKEDLVLFKRERINLERPQKLGPLDVGLIYFRGHLAKRARDYQRKPESSVTATAEVSAGNRSRPGRAPSEGRE